MGTEISISIHDNWIHNIIVKTVQLALSSEGQSWIWSQFAEASKDLPQRQCRGTGLQKWRLTQSSAMFTLIFLHIYGPRHRLRKSPVMSVPTEEDWAAQSAPYGPFYGAQVLMICMLWIPCLPLLFSQYSSPLPPNLLQARLHFGNPQRPY